jgi:hypothetical protein
MRFGAHSAQYSAFDISRVGYSGLLDLRVAARGAECILEEQVRGTP